MQRLKIFWDALKYGQQLENSAGWKNRQNTTNTLVGLIGVVLATAKIGGYDLPVSDADVVLLAGAGAAVLGMLNGYLTTATTDKIGLPTVDPSPARVAGRPEPAGNIPGETRDSNFPPIDKTLMD